MRHSLISNKISIVLKLTIFVLALTGAAQMPIFKRYYIADLPGLGWLSDFYLTNKIHYIFGAVLLFLLAYIFTLYLGVFSKTHRVTVSGKIKGLFFILVCATGIMRVIKNLNSVTLDPFTVMLIDWTHLGFAILLGLIAAVTFITGKKRYLKSLKDH
jgi:hypothetical protein